MPELLTRRVLEQMLAAVDLPLALVDASRRHAPLCWVNPPFERMTGFGRRPLLDARHPWLDEPGRLAEALDALPAGEDSHLELAGRHADGKAMQWRLRVSPLEGAAGRVAWWLLAGEPEPVAAAAPARRVLREDPVAGVLTREWFEQLLVHQLAGARRRERPLALLVFEVEHFDLYLETFGPKAGDNCLRLVAHGIAAAMRRTTDLVARVSGCRFVALAEDMDEPRAEAHLARIRSAVEALCIHHPKSPVGRYVTVRASCRVGVPGRDESVASWLEAAPAGDPPAAIKVQRGSG
jgi:diguanylate cyclase (GGDEF)-like protein